MAFDTKLITNNYGLKTDNCYAKIDSFSGNKTFIKVKVGFYYNKDCRDNGADPIATKEYDIQYCNGISQMYMCLMEFEEFKNAKIV